MEGDGSPSTSCRGMPRVLAGELPLLEQCVPVTRHSLRRWGEVVRSQRGGTDLTGDIARLLLRWGKNTAWCHQPQPSAVDTNDRVDKEMPLRPKLEERKSECELGFKTSLFLHSEVTHFLNSLLTHTWMPHWSADRKQEEIWIYLSYLDHWMDLLQWLRLKLVPSTLVWWGLVRNSRAAVGNRHLFCIWIHCK